MLLLKPFNRRWWWITIIVIAGMALLIRLGFWQLDRLEQRRALNLHIATRWREEPIDLNNTPLPADLDEWDYRRVQLQGTFDYERQIVLLNQSRMNAPGVMLVTPLKLDDNHAVLVVRGWVPIQQADPEYWPQFEEPADATIIGIPFASQPSTQPPAEPQTEWFRIDIDAIQRQMPYELLPIFVEQMPEEGRPYSALPYREEPMILSEGNHFSYAIQWFSFALILGGGYLLLIQAQERREQRLASGELYEDVPGDALSDPEAPRLPPQEHHA